MTEYPPTASSVVRYLAAVSKSKTRSDKPKTSVLGRGVSWSWEGNRHLGLFQHGNNSLDPMSDDKAAGRLASLDALQPADNIIRAGWLWVSGQVADSEGKLTRYCFPVLSTTIKLKRGSIQHGLLSRVANPIGDAILSDLLGDWAEGLTHTSITSSWVNNYPTGVTANQIAVKLGVAAPILSNSATDPRLRLDQPGLALTVGVGIYSAASATTFNLSDRISDWNDEDISDTAFSSIYTGTRGHTPSTPKSVWPFPSRPLSRIQSAVIDASATEPVVTVSGPPGTGKTHTMVEIALAATARGESVLLAASSPHAVDVMAKHFESSPGPTPITFGGHTAPDTDSQISRRLNQSGTQGSVGETSKNQEQTGDQVAAQESSIAALLRAESIASVIGYDPATRVSLATRFPSSVNLAQVDELIAKTAGTGLVNSWRRGSRLKRAAGLLGLGTEAELASVRQARDELNDFRMASRILADGGLTLESSFDRLSELDKSSQRATSSRLNAIFEHSLSSERQGRQALGDISTAVRASRSKRREILASLAESSLTEAAPLWLGLVRDIDDVLPAKPAMFDLVILDEASQIDQASAAGALLRAKRAVVCGDPAQLRHVSFVSDAAMEQSMQETIGHQVPALDVRRNSIFDVASGSGIGFGLNEHYRCVPHLISFSARRFYDDTLHVATTTPLNHDADRIEIVWVEGGRDAQKVNRNQVEAALAQIAEARSGYRSIGVVSPFRDQVDALTEAVLDTYRPEEIEDMGLSIGTVHAFQGSEHDFIIIMLAVGTEEGSAAWRFVNNANLFNVMVTRARQHIVVLNSTEEPPGLAGQYLVYSDPLSSSPKSHPHTTRWPRQVTEALDSAGVAYWANYKVGSHRLDFALSSPERPVALIVEPHPDGPEAHIERDLFLRLLGWTVRDAFASRWSNRLGELTASLATQGISYDA